MVAQLLDHLKAKNAPFGRMVQNMHAHERQKYATVMIRPLGLGNDDDKALKDGGVYNVGFAVHDDNITTRGHHVSFVRTLGVGAKADIQAVKLP